MKSSPLAAIAATALIALASSGCKHEAAHDVPVVDLTAATAETTDVNRLNVTDVVYTPLDTATAALLGGYCNIAGVAGDTIVLADIDNVWVFNLADGRLVSRLNHKGNGPGEYNWIERVFVDRPNSQLVIKGAGGGAHRYTFADSLVESYPVPRFYNRRFAIGSLNSGIYILDERKEGDVIRILDPNFNLTDSIPLPGYNLGYYAGIFEPSGERALISMADTVYEIKPSGLEKALITDRHGRFVTPEKEQEFYRMEAEERNNVQNSYIQFYSALLAEDCITLIAYLDNNAYLLVFDANDGTLLSRTLLDEENPGLKIDWRGVTLPAAPQYYADGRFYAIISEDYAVDADGQPNNGELNSGVISFRLERAE